MYKGVGSVFVFGFCVALVHGARVLPSADKWEPLRDFLQGSALGYDFAVSAGVWHEGEHKALFSYAHGNVTMATTVGAGSTSKWPSAMMLAGAVADGTVESLDEPVHRYVKWWTADRADRRSRVTLRHLLTFTSGFGADEQDLSHPLICMSNSSADLEACSKTIYEVIGGVNGSFLTGEPGSTYSYNSNHLQLAAAVVTSASGLGIQEVIEKYLRSAFKMPDTGCSGSNPILAECFTTTGDDYGNFLAGVLGYSPLPKSLVDESEEDATPSMSNWYTRYGDYAFGHFLWCFDSVAGFTEECQKAQVHAEIGDFGHLPMLDRRLEYYIQVVAFENSEIAYPRSRIPENLAQLIKPVADAIMSGRDVSFSEAHPTPVFKEVLTRIDVNLMSDCHLHPEHCGGTASQDIDVVIV